MLVFTRRIGDEIVINGQIRLRVTATGGDRVRLGVSAPPEIRVDRAEIFQRRQREEESEYTSQRTGTRRS